MTRDGSQSAGVQLGPTLPMSVFTSAALWNVERVHALAIYCSDGRWGEAFDEFCHRSLAIPHYDRLAVPGGPAWLVPAESDLDPRGDSATATSWSLQDLVRSQLEFLVKTHELERIVLITHYGCAYYGKWLQKGPDDCLEPQTDDLQTAAEFLRAWFPDVKVEGYLAMRNGNSISFHRVET